MRKIAFAFCSASKHLFYVQVTKRAPIARTFIDFLRAEIPSYPDIEAHRSAFQLIDRTIRRRGTRRISVIESGDRPARILPRRSGRTESQAAPHRSDDKDGRVVIDAFPRILP